MKKKIIYFALSAILVWAALVSWNWAPVFAERWHCATLWFDLLSVILGTGAVAVSCAASESPDADKKEG